MMKTVLTFDVVLGLVGGANLTVPVAVSLHLANVGPLAVDDRAVCDAGQLDVVDVAVAIGPDVSCGLVQSEGQRTQTHHSKTVS